MKIAIPPYLCTAHSQAYLVGGSVRDLVRGTKPTDYDIAVFGDPMAYAGQLAERLKTRVIILGKDRFSVYRLVAGAASIDITPAKGRDIQADLLGRDFTINALACNLCDGQVVDVTGGLADLSNRVVRMVSPAAFQDDPARLIRAYRMAAALDFQIEPQTAQAIANQAASIQRTAGERVWSELQMVLSSVDSHIHILGMAQSGLLSAIIPQLRPMKGCRQNRHHAYDVFDHSLHAHQAMGKVLMHVEHYFDEPAAQYIKETESKTRAVLKLAILLHDAGKPASCTFDASGTPHFYGHAVKSAQIAQAVGLQLRLSNQDRKRLVFIVQNHQRPLSLFLSAQADQHHLPPKALGRFLRHCGDHTPHLLVHALADYMGKGTKAAGMKLFLKRLMAAYFERQHTPQDPLLNGQDIIDHFGISPSPLIGDLLRRVEQARLAGMIRDREQALAWVTHYLAGK